MPDNLLARIGVLTISDRASRGEYEDISGKAINDFLGRALRSNWVAVIRIVPDGTDSVAQALIEMVEREDCDLILTTGGTGPAPRDLTPEAMRMVITRELEGFGELMRRISLEEVPTATLPADRRNARKMPDRQSAGTPLGHRCLPERGISSNSLLSRSDRGATNRGQSRCMRSIPSRRIAQACGRNRPWWRSCTPTRPIRN